MRLWELMWKNQEKFRIGWQSGCCRRGNMRSIAAFRMRMSGKNTFSPAGRGWRHCINWDVRQNTGIFSCPGALCCALREIGWGRQGWNGVFPIMGYKGCSLSLATRASSPTVVGKPKLRSYEKTNYRSLVTKASPPQWGSWRRRRLREHPRSPKERNGSLLTNFLSVFSP